MRRKWVKGLLLNYASMIITAISTLICNLLLALSYDSQIVGRFNYTLVWLLILGQVGTLGSHQAVMCYTAQHPKEQPKIMGGAVIISGVVTAVLSLILEILAVTVVRREYKIWIVLLGATVLFHVLNKLALNCLNGMGAMSTYAGLNMFRGIVFIVCAIGLEHYQVNGQFFFLCYTLSEFLTCVLGIGGLLCAGYIELCMSWIKRLLIYGVRIMPAMVSAELKTKGFVLIMKIFLRDNVLGVYSFAMLFVEGFYQLYVTLRTNLNPYLAKNMRIEKTCERIVNEKMNRVLRMAGPCMAFLTVGGYYVIVCLLEKAEYERGIAYLAVSVIAIVLTGRLIIYQNCISFSGFPQYESAAMLLSAVFDLCSCFISIWLWGEAGMLFFATSSYLVSGMLIYYFLRKGDTWTGL